MLSPVWVRALASGLGAGRSPVAPGTAGTLVAVPLGWALAGLPIALRLGLLLAVLPAAAWVCGEAARRSGEKDPGWIVLDEIVGFLFAVSFVPARPSVYGAAFLLFRLFDIIKPPPARQLDRGAPGGWGILLDDVCAGLYAALALAFLRLFGVP